jgi:hypothetical protein
MSSTATAHTEATRRRGHVDGTEDAPEAARDHVRDRYHTYEVNETSGPRGWN